LTTSGAWAGAVSAELTGAAVNHQNIPDATAPARTITRKIRRGIHRSVNHESTASMEGIPSLICLKISSV